MNLGRLLWRLKNILWKAMVLARIKEELDMNKQKELIFTTLKIIRLKKNKQKDNKNSKNRD